MFFCLGHDDNAYLLRFLIQSNISSSREKSEWCVSKVHWLAVSLLLVLIFFGVVNVQKDCILGHLKLQIVIDFCTVHFWQKKWYFNSLIFFFRISKTSLKGNDTMTFLDFPLTATHLEYFMEWFLLLDESDSLVSVIASASSSKFIFIHSHYSFPSSSFP